MDNLIKILCESKPLFKILKPAKSAAKELKTGKVYEHMNYVLNTPFMQIVLLIGQAAKNLALLDTVDSTTFLQPAFFLTNYEDLPLQGLTLINQINQIEKYPNLWYVGLNTSDQSIDSNSIERIISHEYGHIIMYNLIKRTILEAFTKSNIHHLTTSITDYGIAFMEGWAIHFELMACDYTETPQLRRWIRDQPKHDISTFWICEKEARLRQWGIRENIFIHETCTPPDLKCNYPEEALKYHMTNSAFNLHRLKSPEDMLSCEGVVGSFFYRLVNDDIIQSTKAQSTLYQKFLPDIFHHQLIEFIDSIDPLTNAYLKIISAFHQMKYLTEIEPPLIMFLKAYAKLFPQEKKQVYAIFLENTCFTTVVNEAANLYEMISLAGSLGNITDLKKLWNEWDQLAASALTQALETNNLTPILKESVWIEIPSIKVNNALWLKGQFPLKLNKVCGLYRKLKSYHLPPF